MNAIADSGKSERSAGDPSAGGDHGIEHYCWAQLGTKRQAPDAESTLHYRDGQMEIHRVVVGDLDNNVFVCRCRQTGEAVLIDAANEHKLLLELCRRLGVRSVLETHGHSDHIGAVTEMRNAGYEVGVTEADAHMLPSYDQVLENESVIEVGRLRLHTTITPGHTDGSICFKVEGSPVLFTGDTLFPGGPGLTRDGFMRREGKPPPSQFATGDFATIIRSIDELMFSKHPPDTIVMPGHGDDTTLGRESPHLQEWIDRGW